MFILGVIAALASGIYLALNIWAGGKIDDAINALLMQLQQFREQIITAVAEILRAINGVLVEVDRVAANNAISQVNRAFYNDAVIFGDVEQALGNSYQADNGLYLLLDPRVPTSIVFLSPFLYGVTLRIAILKQLRPSYYCEAPFVDEYQQYIDRANYWIQQINDSITASHTVTVRQLFRGTGDTRQSRWVATHFRNRVVVQIFSGAWGDDSEATQASVTQQANDSRARGIQRDRQDFGVVDMENTVSAWREAFHGALRAALVREVLNRPAMAIDFNPDGLMVDGRILPVGSDLRATLLERTSDSLPKNRHASCP